MRYIVLEDILGSGWIPTWSETTAAGHDVPVTFPSPGEARAAVRAHQRNEAGTARDHPPGQFHVVPYLPALHDAQWRAGRDRAS